MQSDLQQRCNDAFAGGPSRIPLFSFSSHQHVLDGLRNGIELGRRLLCLTGPTGSGKSAVLTTLYDSLPLGYVGLVSQPGLGDVWAGLRGQLRLSPGTGTSVSRDNLLAALLEAQTQKLPIVQLIDNADKLRPQDFIQLNRFFDRCNGQIVLAGSEDLHALFPGADDATGRQRSGQVYTLEPLSNAETEAYIAHRLQLAGFDPELFAPDALAAVAEYSGGTPRLINMLCFVALSESCSAGVRGVTADDIDAVARQRWESGIYPFRTPPPSTQRAVDPASQRRPVSPPSADSGPERAAEDERTTSAAQDAEGSRPGPIPHVAFLASDDDQARAHPDNDFLFSDTPRTGHTPAADSEPSVLQPPAARDSDRSAIAETPAPPASEPPGRGPADSRHDDQKAQPRHRSPPAAPVTPAKQAQSPAKRRRWPMAAAASLVVAGVAVVLALGLSGPDGPVDQLRGAFAQKLHQIAAAIDDGTPAPPTMPTAAGTVTPDNDPAIATESTPVEDALSASTPDTGAAAAAPPVTANRADAPADETDITRHLPSPAAGPPSPPDPQPIAPRPTDIPADTPAAPATASDPAARDGQTEPALPDATDNVVDAPMESSDAPETRVVAKPQPEPKARAESPQAKEPQTAAADAPALSPAQRAHVAELYRKRAEYEIDKGEYAHALTSIDYGLESEPNHPRLKHLRLVVLNELEKSAPR